MFLRLFKYLWPERYLPETPAQDPFDENPPPCGPGRNARARSSMSVF
ncbi:hypothetical protein AZ23_3983 [Bordetella bronchiseptica E010]|nr:hypothetical protein AZ23_3983 [Bordetella bronchiseptica E010]